MPEESYRRAFDLKRLKGLARSRESPCQLVEFVARAEGIEQGDVRHPALEVPIVNLANRLNGRLRLAGRDQYDGSGKGFPLHTTPRKWEGRPPDGFWTLRPLAFVRLIMYDNMATR